ncbi:GGDEF domain-containing protein [Salinibius halmophilus]|uniref:GGDEF domain-containing protein n=1 Tax=Salinibius halmophilus TaxID=1853216 RepID=UPI000E65F68A|nr:GGDEF domain-containing protein [Salinibius halmophilus]
MDSSNISSTHLKVISNSPAVHQHSADISTERLRHSVLEVMQTSLDIERQIELLFDTLRAPLQLSGITYKHEPEGVRLFTGNNTRHRVQYQLTSKGDYYGDLAFTRSKRWDEATLTLLENTLERVVWPLRNALAYRQAVRISLTDPLTGIGNRGALEQAMVREIAGALRFKQPLSLIIADIDHFKAINDRYGHERGDTVLQEVANNIADSLRKTDTVYRYGGEEFVVLLPRTSTELARIVAERLQKDVQQVVLPDSNKVTASFGIAELHNGQDAATLLQRADQALYRAKNAGRNCIQCDQLTQSKFG